MEISFLTGAAYLENLVSINLFILILVEDKEVRYARFSLVKI